ncbi:hypothetical protein GF358_03445 [Candidatus Woesearchaeota archaeon]|nr:hypothetical protein [Candidatus Woesearchaeota archaeon]
MDQALSEFIKKNSGMPLPELKLELMKRGFSSYQIEQALRQVRAKRQSFWIYLIVFLIIIIFFVIIGLVFVSFIRPAEELIKAPAVKESPEKEFVVVPSERPTAPEKPFVEEKDEIKEEFIEEKIESVPETREETKSLSEIRALSNTNPSDAVGECSLLQNVDKCVSLVAKNTNNPDLCREIDDSDIRDNCFLFFGQSNEIHCADILSTAVRRSCFLLADIEEI